jgi:hypothetical protein
MALRQSPGAPELQATEVAVIHAASRILAALIQNGRLTNGNHSGLIRFAVERALEISRETERLIHGAGEIESDAPGERDILDLLDEGPESDSAR